MKSSIKIGAVIVLLIMSGCGTTLKRHTSLGKSQTNNDLVKISMLSTSFAETSQTSPFKTVFDLSDKGQSVILSNRNNEQSTEILNQKFQQQQQQGKHKTIDLTTKNVRITFSISRDVSFDKENFNAFDRIENLKYKFELSSTATNNGIKFSKWNKYTTEYGTLDIGTLEYNQGFTANLDITGEVGANYSSKSNQKIDENNSTESSTTLGPKVSATGKLGYTQSQKENQTIKQRFIQLTGEFNNKSFSIHQQGNRETELAGNVSIELTINLPKDEMLIASFGNLFDSKLNRKETKDVSLNLIRYYIPDVSKINEGINGKLNYDFAVRHIIRGTKTFAEFDDRVCYVTGHKELDNVVLIEKDDLTTTAYYLTIDDKPLQINGETTVQFLNFTEALELKTWLFQTLTTIADGQEIEISNNKIAFEGLSIRQMKDNRSKIKIVATKNQ